MSLRLSELAEAEERRESIRDAATRSATASKSADLSAKKRYTEPIDVSARSAISCMVAASTPRSAKTSAAASRIV